MCHSVIVTVFSRPGLNPLAQLLELCWLVCGRLVFFLVLDLAASSCEKNCVWSTDRNSTKGRRGQRLGPFQLFSTHVIPVVTYQVCLWCRFPSSQRKRWRMSVCVYELINARIRNCPRSFLQFLILLLTFSLTRLVDIEPTVSYRSNWLVTDTDLLFLKPTTQQTFICFEMPSVKKGRDLN